ncbi:hypothetical protein C1H46_027987 [Malus baccata]|uniref:Protein RESISTANCE TO PHYTOPHTHORA 1, chloroplastic n=1 Tax=Malus baccata TaxID=106549 RepID=A0A540LJ46_MALBA|nr:hypothetical protein C1H46_027987 [Malus baccata]
MNTLTSTTLCNFQVSRYPFTVSNPRNVSPCNSPFPTKFFFRLYANANELDAPAAVEEPKQEPEEAEPPEARKSSTFSAAAASPLDKDLKKSDFDYLSEHSLPNRMDVESMNPMSEKKGTLRVVQKTAATFAPRASTASKNPAVPGSTLYTVFEVQAYASMLLGGVLSFNLIFPSNQPDIWRLMGMWSIWMFTIPSLRARDCSKNEKEALNYLFLLVPLLNVTIPFFVKSFAVVWSADTVAFFAMYAWKLGWLERKD